MFRQNVIMQIIINWLLDLLWGLYLFAPNTQMVTHLCLSTDILSTLSQF